MPNEFRQLAVAMIVRNESATIRESIASIAEIADEIIVHDFSDDSQTEEAAAGFDVQWIRGQWNDHFAEARNACLKAVTADWILWLDAGEALTENEATQLRRFVDDEANEDTAYMMLVAAPPSAAGMDAEQIGQIRLHSNNPSLQFEGRVRESLNSSIDRAGLQLDGLPFVLQRGDRENSAERKEIRARRNLRLVDLEIAANGPTALATSFAPCAKLSIAADTTSGIPNKTFKDLLRFSSPSDWRLITGMVIAQTRTAAAVPIIKAVGRSILMTFFRPLIDR